MAPASPGPQVRSASSSVWSRTEEAAPGGKCPCPVQAPATGVELQNPLDVASVMSTPVGGAHRGAEPPSLGKGQKLCGKHGTSRAAAGASLLTGKELQGSRQPPGAGRPPQGLSETLREGGTGRWVFRARTGGGWPHPEAPVVTYLSGACASFSPVHLRPEPALQETRRESASPGVPGYVASVEQAPINHGCRHATTGARNSFRRCPRKTARALKS